MTIDWQTLLPERYKAPVPTVTEPLKSQTGGGLLLGLLDGGGLLDDELGGLLLDGELDELLPLDELPLLGLELEHLPPMAITSHRQESAQYFAAPRTRDSAFCPGKLAVSLSESKTWMYSEISCSLTTTWALAEPLHLSSPVSSNRQISS